MDHYCSRQFSWFFYNTREENEAGALALTLLNPKYSSVDSWSLEAGFVEVWLIEISALSSEAFVMVWLLEMLAVSPEESITVGWARIRGAGMNVLPSVIPENKRLSRFERNFKSMMFSVHDSLAGLNSNFWSKLFKRSVIFSTINLIYSIDLVLRLYYQALHNSL